MHFASQLSLFPYEERRSFELALNCHQLRRVVTTGGGGSPINHPSKDPLLLISQQKRRIPQQIGAD